MLTKIEAILASMPSPNTQRPLPGNLGHVEYLATVAKELADALRNQRHGALQQPPPPPCWCQDGRTRTVHHDMLCRQVQDALALYDAPASVPEETSDGH